MIADKKQFLEWSLARYEDFTRASGETPEQRRMLGRAYLRVARIRYRLGMWTESSAAYDRAIDVFAALRREYPDDPRYAEGLAGAHYNHGNVQGKLRQAAAALQSYETARIIQEQLVDRHPAVVRYAVDLGGIYCTLGLNAPEDTKDHGLDWFNKSIARLEPFRQQKSAKALVNLSNAYGGRGRASMLLGRREEAITHYKAARDLMNELFQ